MRVKLRDRIIKCAEILQLNRKSIKLLEWMYDNQENGVVFNISYYINDFLTLYNLSYSDYYEAGVELVKADFIKPEKNGNVRLLVYSEAHIKNILNKFEQRKKRKYTKDPGKEQCRIDEAFDKKGIKKCLEVIMSSAREPYKLNIPKSIKILAQGLKIPVAFRPYLSSELLKENELLQDGNYPDNYKYFYFDESYDKEYLAELEEERRNLSKEEKRLLLAIIFMAKYGKIDHFNVPALIDTINEIFGKTYSNKNNFARATVYRAIKELIRLGFIEIVKNEEGVESLIIKYYSKSFGEGKNYVVVPLCVLRWTFKKLPTGAIKAFFYFVFLLNNGEGADRIQKVGQNKAIYFKIRSKSLETGEQKAKFRRNLEWLKRRCSTEIENLFMPDVFGKGTKKSELTSLTEYFDFHYLEDADNIGTVLQVRIRKEYFITKKAIIDEVEIDPVKRYPRKAKVVQELIKDRHHIYTEEDIKSFTRTFRRASRRVMSALIGYVDDRLKAIDSDKGVGRLKKIEHIGKYMSGLYKRYKAGELVGILNNNNEYYEELYTAEGLYEG